MRAHTHSEGFWGLTSFNRHFVCYYASPVAHLTNILRSTKFVWGTNQAATFTTLQRKMTDMPTLTLPNFKKKFILETDASGVAISTILFQDGHPIAFFSKKMCPRMQPSSVYVCELFDITKLVKKWLQYPLRQEFHIYTDQKSLRILLLQKIQTLEHHKWATKLQGFNIEIFYKPGKSNLVADTLIRKYTTTESLLFLTSSPIPYLISTLRECYAKDRVGQSVISKLLINESYQIHYKFSNGLLFYKEKIFIPDIKRIRFNILQEFHATPIARHSRLKATLARISTSFCLSGIYKEANILIKQCDICQHNKYLTKKMKGLLQLLPVPKRVRGDISMDFITHLPKFFGHTTIWVICDRLTKYAQFIAMPSHFTTQDLAKRFTVDIARLHDHPKYIVSVRDPLFLCTILKAFFKEQGTMLKYILIRI